MTKVRLTTSAGPIVLELDEENAPASTANFLEYVRAGHYDNTVFHRVIDGFMIQGGGMEPGMKHKPTLKPIANEAGNVLKNRKYTVAMARTSDPNSATSQFFINVNDNKSLNFRSPDPAGIGYTAFGKVVSGMDVVNKIAKTPKGKAVPPGVPISPNDLPKDAIVINKATVVDASASPAK